MICTVGCADAGAKGLTWTCGVELSALTVIFGTECWGLTVTTSADLLFCACIVSCGVGEPEGRILATWGAAAVTLLWLSLFVILGRILTNLSFLNMEED